MILARLLVLVLALAALTGCDDGPARPADRPPSRPAPALGGEPTDPTSPPDDHMDAVERAIAAELSDELRDQRLSVDHLSCPQHDRTPMRLTCRSYVAGVVADVEVRLAGPRDRIRFDARLGDGILATANLVRRLEAAGYTRVDCGDRPAYPSEVGDQIVCSVVRGKTKEYVVATVTTEDGAVEISDY